jgi:16S rRNA (guanine527-N7)-methyltransferase
VTTGFSNSAEARLFELAARFALSADSTTKLRLLVERLVSDPLAPTSIRDPVRVIDRHLADSLVALELEPVRHAELALDLGSGAGVPGLPLAIALPHVSFVLLESSARKCAFIERTAAACEISNVRVVAERAELYDAGRGRHDLVTARAVARLHVTAEYAAPLLRVGGTLVAWGARRSAEDEATTERAGAELGLGQLGVRPVDPFPGALSRHLYLMSKVSETPSRFPRRPGMARKRPLGTTTRAGGSSDRMRR